MELNCTTGSQKTRKAIITSFEAHAARRARRTEAIQEAAETLDICVQDITTAAINIAMSDTWYDWDQAVPHGTTMEFGPDILSTCPDPSVRALADLLALVMDYRETRLLEQ